LDKWSRFPAWELTRKTARFLLHRIFPAALSFRNFPDPDSYGLLNGERFDMLFEVWVMGEAPRQGYITCADHKALWAIVFGAGDLES